MRNNLSTNKERLNDVLEFDILILKVFKVQRRSAMLKYQEVYFGRTIRRFFGSTCICIGIHGFGMEPQTVPVISGSELGV